MTPRVAGCALAVLAAARLEAQTLPHPRPTGAVETEGRRLEYAIGLGAGWDADEAARAGALVPHAALARSFAGPRSRLDLTARGRAVRHPGEGALDRHEASLAADAVHRSSAATTWRAAASIGAGEGDESPIVLEHGLLLPAARLRTATAAAGVTRVLSPRTALRLDARALDAAFDSASLADTRSLRLTAAAERRLGARTDAAFVYAVERSEAAPAPSTLTHFASAQWTRRLSARDALLLEGGASYTPDAARAGLDGEASLLGGVAVSRALRHGTIAAFVRREVTPAFGAAGARFDLRGGLAADFGLGPSWRLQLSTVGARGDGGTRSGADATASVGRRLGRVLMISAEGRYRRRGAGTGQPAQESLRAGLFLTVASRRAPAIAPAPAF